MQAHRNHYSSLKIGLKSIQIPPSKRPILLFEGAFHLNLPLITLSIQAANYIFRVGLLYFIQAQHFWLK